MSGNDEDEDEKMRRWRGWLVGFDGSIMMMRDGIPSLSVAVFCFCFCFSFLSFSFFCSFLSFLMHTSGGRKAVPRGLQIDERDVRRIDRETAIEIKGRRMVVLCRRRKRKNQILRVLYTFSFLLFPFRFLQNSSTVIPTPLSRLIRNNSFPTTTSINPNPTLL